MRQRTAPACFPSRRGITTRGRGPQRHNAGRATRGDTVKSSNQFLRSTFWIGGALFAGIAVVMLLDRWALHSTDRQVPSTSLLPAATNRGRVHGKLALTAATPANEVVERDWSQLAPAPVRSPIRPLRTEPWRPDDSIRRTQPPMAAGERSRLATVEGAQVDAQPPVLASISSRDEQRATRSTSASPRLASRPAARVDDQLAGFPQVARHVGRTAKRSGRCLETRNATSASTWEPPARFIRPPAAGSSSTWSNCAARRC